MRNITFMTLMAATVGAWSVPASAADNHLLFAGNPTPVVTLTLDGTTPYMATNTGFFSDIGYHYSANKLYLVGTSDNSPAIGTSFNDFFTFTIGASRTLSSYTSATISFSTGNSTGVGPYVLTLYDVGASPDDLDKDRLSANSAGQDIYSDLQTGTIYGQKSFPGPYMVGQTISMSLNNAFISAINSGTVQTFSIGGTLNSPLIQASVPEPTTWALTIVGFGAVGAMMRRRRATTLLISLTGR